MQVTEFTSGDPKGLTLGSEFFRNQTFKLLSKLLTTDKIEVIFMIIHTLYEILDPETYFIKK